MSKVTSIFTFRKCTPVNMQRECKPKIVYNNGRWRVVKSKALNQIALDANYNALLFAVWKNNQEFLSERNEGDFCGKEEKGQDQEAS